MKQLSIILLLLLVHFTIWGAEVQITNLKVEYTQTPLGIDIQKPNFSWQMQVPSKKRGFKQSAYQIEVINEYGEIVWNTGKTKTDISLNIKYSGAPLAATTRYKWSVKVWDNHNRQHTAESWFETGPMNSDHQSIAWNNAQWIGGNDDDMVLYSQYLPVFKIEYNIQLDENSESVKAGFIYGANDIRLMDKNKNLFNIESTKNESYLKVELDISHLHSGKPATLNIYRVGYHPDDKKDVPFKTFSIPELIINNDNKYESHQINIYSNLGETQLFIDGTTQGNRVGRIYVNPIGWRGGDYIAFPVVGDIGFDIPANQKAAFSNITISNFRSPSNIIFSEDLKNQPYNGIFTDLPVNYKAYLLDGGMSGNMIFADPSRNSMPLLRSTFSSESEIAKARLYVTARGIYEMYINGQRIGNSYFSPENTQYNKTHLYQTYDVGEYIQTGQNAIGAILGEGWWSGGITFLGNYWNFYGDRQSLLAKLVITYKDGSSKVITTNPETWTYYNNGPIRYGSMFQGEVYDARKEKEIEGWSTANYDASSWHQTTVITTEGTVSNENTSNWPDFDDFKDANMIGQIDPSVQAVKELNAVDVKEVRPGVFIYDMGQNMVGIPKVTLENMDAGQEIILRFSEVLYPTLPEYKANTGMLMMENIRAAMAQEIYITKGGDTEIIQPRFTYHGFRYLEITGIDKALALEAVKGIVLSSVHKLNSGYETSNPLVNQFWKNITWSTYGNFVSIPTDCPQRNERLGWSGDISVFSRTATYLADLPLFFRRHMLAMRDLQRKDGHFPNVAPLDVGFGETLWGSAGITVAWESYQQYGDVDLLKEHYDAMKKYIEYLTSRINPDSGILCEDERNQWSSLGDWLSLEDSRNEKTLLWESYFIFDLEIMIKVASVLGKKEDEIAFKDLYKNRKSFFNKIYIDGESGKTAFQGKMIDTQGSYVLPLAFNIIEDSKKAKVLDQFITSIKRKNKIDNGPVCDPYSLMTGFISTAWINKALSDNGYSEIAYKLLQQTSYPSWLYPVTQGATTIWERLNSYTHTNGFGGNNSMNSFNHYSFGAVGSWMYNYSLGITRDEEFPGFKHFILQPEPDPTSEMTYAKGHYDSMYGRIESSWNIENGIYHYRFVVPANTSATVYIPVADNQKVELNKKQLKDKNINFIKMENGKAIYKINSGEYTFDVL
ncbi:family 78 glycoside hydrolase catalytic domain [Carboxylicivirga linearis]|uniref:alpha-L-rhamnosidase n=1 Tax=Carboxylicivirga linearis TaxID=1628157 RepID=A0ABS5JZV3_9BACT|nr:family 78 glycoside hydrolase catalytic domain [Carboxylicivirga linearis]MBS2099946.1 family 78 glycoside hydrolase catalytic domain [Carboxylicivirga linearis]